MQSLVCLALCGVLLVAARSASLRVRATVTTVTLVTFVVMARLLPFSDTAFMMGDGTSLVHDRGNFEGVVLDEGVVRFSAHLAYWLLGRFDGYFGATSESPLAAYRLLSFLAGIAAALGVWCLSFAEAWSARAVRFAALVLMTPATLMYFGYLEVGYLSLSAAAFPLVARGLAKGADLTVGLVAGALLFGLGAAMHGIGYVSIAALFVAVLAADVPRERRLVLAITLAAVACGAALIGLWFYLSVLGLDVVPGHASNGFIVRSLWRAREAEGRIVSPFFSIVAGRDLLIGGLIAGLPTALVAALDRRVGSRESRVALMFAVPCAMVFASFWPVQGVAIEIDMLVAAFPAVFALLWACACSVRATLVSAAILALGHGAFWWVVADPRFVNAMLR